MSRDSFRDPAAIHGRNALQQFPDEATVYASADPSTEEPLRTLTAVERDTEARIAQAQEHIAAGRPVLWSASVGDPNDELTEIWDHADPYAGEQGRCVTAAQVAFPDGTTAEATEVAS